MEFDDSPWLRRFFKRKPQESKYGNVEQAVEGGLQHLIRQGYKPRTESWGEAKVVPQETETVVKMRRNSRG